MEKRGFLTLEEVAEYLGTSVRFPRRLVEEQRIPYHKFGTHVRIHERDLAAYVAANRVPVREVVR